jgi:hypothetical protein
MLEDYFTDEALNARMCKERVKEAGKLHDQQYIARLAGHGTEEMPSHPFYQLLPPRRQWTAYRPRRRRPNVNPDYLALQNAVSDLPQREPNEPWVQRLNYYRPAIRERVFGCHPFVLAPPEVQWIPKNKGSSEYRALCVFSPDDNLILCQFARYLRDVFDGGFSDSSYAFRSQRDGRMPTHHQAFNEILELKQSAPGQDFYVAECDIRGFFDAVDHDVALAAFQKAAKGKSLHHRAEAIFRAYVNCYSFPQNVLAEAEPRLKQRDPKGYFKWPADALKKHHANPHQKRIGIPQGGAISGVIANLVLDYADKAVEKAQRKLHGQVHYFRYCDDMVLISKDKQNCEAVYGAYLKALNELKLPYHKPETTCVYGKTHWDHKSKSPYCWSGRKWFGCVPWVQFVGYQIRYDGLVRPRKESVKKQAAKMAKTVSKLKHGLMNTAQPILASRSQARMSLKSKLVAQGVGRIKGGEIGPKPMCWTSGFKGLHGKPFVPGCLRLLDGVRSNQIRRFDGVPIRYGLGRPSQRVRRREPVGFAFSYEAQFINDGGRELIENPWRPGNRRELFRACIYNKLSPVVAWLDKMARVIIH